MATTEELQAKVEELQCSLDLLNKGIGRAPVSFGVHCHLVDQHLVDDWRNSLSYALREMEQTTIPSKAGREHMGNATRKLRALLDELPKREAQKEAEPK